MGIKMPVAFYESKRGIIKVSEANLLNSRESLNRDSLSCAYQEAAEKCSAKVTFTEGYNTKQNRIVSSYFRLKRFAKHADWCRFNPNEIVKSIARESNPDVFDEIEAGKYELRLNIIKESLIEIEREKERIYSDKPTLPTRETQFVNHGQLPSYFRTARQIAQLRAQMETSNDLRALITLRSKDKKIAWDNFFYEFDNYRKCFDYLQKLSWAERHPVCIAGQIKEFVEPAKVGKDGKPLRIIKLWRPKGIKNSDGHLCVPSVSLYINDDDIWDNAKKAGVDNLIFAYANYKALPSAPKIYNEQTVKYLDIRGGIYHRYQVFICSAEDFFANPFD